MNIRRNLTNPTASERKWHAFAPIKEGYTIDKNGESYALFSPCLRYRPVLERKTGDSEQTILWLGMNPSTADAFRNDPTVKREVDFSAKWGYGRYLKANVCDYRSTDPKGMLEAPEGARSPFNIGLIRMLAAVEKPTIVLCYGVLPKPLQWIANETVAALHDEGHDLFCLGVTKGGMPKHPLYLRADSQLVRFQKV